MFYQTGRIQLGERVVLDDVNYGTRTVGVLVDDVAIEGEYGTHTIVTSSGNRFRSEGRLKRAVRGDGGNQNRELNKESDYNETL
jgi:hypothetical protein